ncbi:MAG TPA: DoxX family protein [Bacteroidota bacterium]|nr:DoxX family protein [Bacteroidota bacterium]
MNIIIGKRTIAKWKRVLYWLSTGMASLALIATGVSDFIHVPPVMEGLKVLGYPAYFATIIGTWQLLGVAALFIPGYPRLTDWAYAGFFFMLTGASMSHAITGDPMGHILVPLLLLGLLTASRLLRSAREPKPFSGTPSPPTQ